MSDLPMPVAGYKPPDIDEHQAEQAKRQKERDAKRPKLLDCLDPDEAKRHEDAKELYEWRVEVALFRKSEGKRHAFMEKFKREVVAQSEQDAWAIFCDTIGEWPSPRDSKPKFTRLQKRSLRDSKG